MSTKPHILIVEDDENLRMALEDNLVDEGYRVTAVGYGRDATRVLESDVPALAIIDIMLPDTDGYSICRRLRELKLPVRVLMLTARTLESDLVEGFEAGADDYLTKPYRLREMLARVKALLRRAGGPDPGESEHLDFAGFELDSQARIIKSPNGEELPLTRTEFDLLLCLLRNRDRALSRDEILGSAWEPDVAVDPRTVDNFVSSVKKKLGWTKDAAYRIKTVRGVGYRLEID